MSSHHVVREKQEPALLVLGLDSFSDELLGQLLEWSPTLIVNAQTAEKVNAFGIKIDIIVGEGFIKSDLQSNLKHIDTANDTQIGAALKYLVLNSYPAVNIITDDFLLKDFLLFVGKINLVVFYDGQKIYPVGSGFSKWKTVGESIKVISGVTSLRTSGLKNKGDNHFITTHDGFFTLAFDQPFIFIAEVV